MRRSVVLVLALVACQKGATDEKSDTKPDKKSPKADVADTNGSGSGSAKMKDKPAQPAQPQQPTIKPPMDVAKPPADATTTKSGLSYKKLKTNDAGTAVKRNDTVVINYTGWKSNGDTFFSTKSRGQPMSLSLSSTAPGFAEAMQLLKKGEEAMLWIPPNIGYKQPPQGGAQPEMLAYQVELVDVVSAPEVPSDVAAPPATAQTTKSGVKWTTVKPGTGDKIRAFDTVTFNYTAWENDGRQFDSTEMRKKPVIAPPFKQPLVMEELLTQMAPNQRIRTWIPAEKLMNGKPAAGAPSGLLCYELEVVSVQKPPVAPPAAPADVAKPPADAKKTPKGVMYKILKTGKGGAHPGPTETVKVHYTGWTTDGRMFDSSIIREAPSQFPLNGVIMGWTEGIPVLAVGDTARFWIPEELAYKGQQGRPQGMLVFDVELLDIIKQTVDEDTTPPTAPKDVAAAPADALKSPGGVPYKFIKQSKGGAHPTAADTVKVHYSGWTTDGKMFDSSVTRGSPAEFPLRGVIKGWTDAIPMLGIGDKARFWIPKELGYGDGGGGRPGGTLVFDVELLEIKPGS